MKKVFHTYYDVLELSRRIGTRASILRSWMAAAEGSGPANGLDEWVVEEPGEEGHDMTAGAKGWLGLGFWE